MEAWIKAVLVSIHNSKMCKKLCSIFFAISLPIPKNLLVWCDFVGMRLPLRFCLCDRNWRERNRLKKKKCYGMIFLCGFVTFACFSCVRQSFFLFGAFLWARNCLLDYICFSNWYIVTLCFYSGLLSLHCASFVLPLSLSLSVARASQMSLHANMTYLLEWTWKKCGKTRFHLVNNKSDEIYRKTSTECLFSCVCLYLSTVNK